MPSLELREHPGSGPVAVGALMTAAAVGAVAAQGTPEYLGAAIALAMVSGLFLILIGFLKLGFLANFLSHPVIRDLLLLRVSRLQQVSLDLFLE